MLRATHYHRDRTAAASQEAVDFAYPGSLADG